MSSLYEQNPENFSSQTFTVSELNREVRSLLEGNFPSILVEGEISNLATPSSGHWYFTLKDASAQVRCAMFRSRNMAVKFRPEEGSQIVVKARLSLYEGRGDYQLLVDRMESVGDGALRQAFEALKQKLLTEGLFDESVKQQLPKHIKHIGVITSPTGAAIKDILSVLKRRFPAIQVTILPVAVQGQNAAPEMIQAIKTANARQGCLDDLDIILIGRGGGSLEDLWAFNDEALARAIHESTLPVVSAVGHEVDFSISDFVADVRAATPSAAAELLSPSQEEYKTLFQSYEQQFTAKTLLTLNQKKQKIDWLHRRLRHPGHTLREQAQRLDELETRLNYSFTNKLSQLNNRLAHAKSSLHSKTPLRQIEQLKKDNAQILKNLRKALSQKLESQKQKLSQYSHALNTVSPLATLGRGYAIAFDKQDNVVRSANDINVGDTLTTRVHQGSILSTVEKIETK